MKESRTRYSALFLLVFFLWGATRAQIFPKIKTLNRLTVGPPYKIIQDSIENSTEESRAFKDVSQIKNDVFEDDQTFDKLETKLSTEVPSEIIVKEMVRNMIENLMKGNIGSPHDWIKDKEGVFNRDGSEKESKIKKEGYANNIRKDYKNDFFNGLNVQMKDGGKQTKNAIEGYHHLLAELESLKTKPTNNETESLDSNEPSPGNWIFPKWRNIKFHKTYTEQDESSQVSGTKSKEYLEAHIIGDKILNDIKIPVESQEVHYKPTHINKKLFKESRQHNGSINRILIFLPPIEEESVFNEMLSEIISESNIFGTIELIHNKNNWMNGNGVTLEAQFINGSAFLMNNSSFDNVSNEIYASSNEKDGFIHKISKRRMPPTEIREKACKKQTNCPYPKPSRSIVHCTETESKSKCSQTCVFGHAVKEGRKRTQTCNRATGFWKPSRVFSDCKPYIDCTITLREGGHMSCKDKNHLHKGQTCHVSCDRYRGKKKVPIRPYTCIGHNRWKPELPRCAIAGSRQRLVSRPRDASEEEEYIPRTELKSHALLGKSLVMKPEKSR